MPTIAELEAQIEKLERRNYDLETRAKQAERATEKAILTAHIWSCVSDLGIEPKAVPDIVARALKNGDWKLDSKGDLLRTRDGTPDVGVAGEYITTKSWLRSLKPEASFYFLDAQNKPASGNVNPWTADDWNLTKQSEYIAKEGMAKAELMAKSAGSTVTAIHPPRTARQGGVL